MRYILGIDQGGSKTHAVVADELGNILGFGSSDGACHSVNGMHSAMRTISEAVYTALSCAHITVEMLSQIVGGLTGADWEHESLLLKEALGQTLHIGTERIAIVNDCMIALRAGTSKPFGCILCVGSGMNCAVRKGPGQEYTFGYYIEDRNQGGNALGRRVLQAVFDAESGLCGNTSLTPLVLEHMGFDTVDAMLYRKVTTGLDGKKILSLPHIVEFAALEGDQVATDVLSTFARDIGQYVVAGLRRFDMLHDRVEVVLSGSVFKCRAQILQQTVAGVIHSAAPNAVIVESEYEPVIGAVLMALDKLSDINTAEIQKHIKRDAQRFHMIRKPQKEKEWKQ